MPGLIGDLVTQITTPANPEIRDFCLVVLDLEIDRAANEMFCEAPPFEPSNVYRSAFDKAKHAQKMAHNRPWLSHTTLELPRHWLTLIGFRICTERDLMCGGLEALKILAAEELGQSLLEISQWDIELLFQVYGNSRLRNEWRYEGLQFRFEERAKQIERC